MFNFLNNFFKKKSDPLNPLHIHSKLLTDGRYIVNGKIFKADNHAKACELYRKSLSKIEEEIRI